MASRAQRSRPGRRGVLNTTNRADLVGRVELCTLDVLGSAGLRRGGGLDELCTSMGAHRHRGPDTATAGPATPPTGPKATHSLPAVPKNHPASAALPN